MTRSPSEGDATPVVQDVRTRAGISLALGVTAFALTGWGFAAQPERAFHAYLAAYAFVLSCALGATAFIAISHAANTTWPVAVRRLPEAVAPALPLLSLLFIPVLIGVPALYPWAHAQRLPEHLRKLVEHRQALMNISGFGLRAAGYLALWSILALALRSLSLAMERGRDAALCARRARRLSYAALPLMAVTVALSAFEWLMSLSADYASTMFGALWIAVCLYSGVASIVVLLGFAQRSPLRLASGASHYSALGRLQFAFLLFLAYTLFFQFLLGWMGNRPSEADWHLARGHGVYFATSLFLLLGHLGLTFFALLPYGLKRSIAWLRVVGVWALFCQYILVNWLVTPASSEPGYSWLDASALVAVLFTCAGVCLWFQHGKSLAPVSDPRYAASLAYVSR